VEHAEWNPRGYREVGLSGQRIAIAGHSHSSDDPDHAEATTDCLTKVISGEWNKIAFFSTIPRYFGYEDRRVFWPNVMFFNFLPTMVGTREQKFGYGRPDQLEAGRSRVLRILDQNRPEKLLVFSTKAWREFPPTLEDADEAEAPPQQFWRTYITPSAHRVKTMGLRHPQGANREAMTAQVSALMAM